MTLYAYDGASPFSLSAAKAKGAILITGYIVGHPGGYDPITKARVNAIRADGMGFLPNWEKGASYLVTCGKSGGVAAGKEAATVVSQLGVPHNGTVAVVFSWDTDINPSDYAKCAQVADGIIQGLAGRYLFSAYGQGGLLKYFAETGRMKVKGWLSGSTSFPGYDPTASYVGMVQETGTNVPGTDRDHIITDPHNIGAWWPDGSPYGDDVTAAEVWDYPISVAGLGAAEMKRLGYTEKAYAAASLVADASWRARDNEQRVSGVQKVAADADRRIAALQAAVAKLQSEVDALKSQSSVQINPVGVTGTLSFKEAV